MSRTRSLLSRLLTTPYQPQPALRTFLDRAQTQDSPAACVTVAVLDAQESERVFGVALARRGIQPVYLKVENRGSVPLRLHLVSINPNYFTALEAAGVNHFSIAKRLSTFGLMAWLFLPLLILIPFKLITASRANRRMDECFRSLAFRLRPIDAGHTREGFVFTPLDSGTKSVHVCLHATGSTLASAVQELTAAGDDKTQAVAAATTSAVQEAVSFTFSIAVPGISADYLRRDFAAIVPPGSQVECDVVTLVNKLATMPAATSNRLGTRTGDPVNLVVIGEFATLLSALAARWDESETITLATCWKTASAFLLGSQYRYSPVSPLYLFGRSQDVALQRTRRSINERLHLRLWLTPLLFHGQSVWIGQISRDIGVRLAKTWNLTTHRIDSDIDESRDYLVEDLLEAERIEASGYLDGVGACDATSPRHNLTGDPYFTDGKRAAILLSTSRTPPRYVAWA